MNKEYPHIVYEERCKARDAKQSELISTEDDGSDKLEGIFWMKRCSHYDHLICFNSLAQLV